MRDVPQNLNIEDVQTKLSCETSLKICMLKMWKRSFRARIPQSLKAEDVKAKLSCERSLQIWMLRMWKRTFRARLPSDSASWRCENGPFVRDVLQSLQAEDVKTNLSCATSLRVCKLKMWKQSFRARSPSKSECWRKENEAFVRAFPQSLQIKAVNAKLSCETSLKI